MTSSKQARHGMWMGVGAALLAAAGSACCWLPLLLLTLGAGSAVAGTVTNTLDTYRPLFGTLAMGAVGVAFYFTYFRRRTPPDASGEACCAAPSKAEAGECSCCHLPGKAVPSRTVRALVKEHLRTEVREGTYVLCLSPACSQVYTGPPGVRPFAKGDLAVRVGFKEQDGPHLVCYCFRHSVEDIEEEVRTQGNSTIPDRIRAEVKAGRCACDVRNPQGSCCLGNVGRAVKEAEARAAGKPASPVGAPSIQCAPSPAAVEGHGDCCGLPGPADPGQELGGRLQRLNRVLLPVVTVAVLAFVLFPHAVFGFLAPSPPPGPISTSGEAAAPGVIPGTTGKGRTTVTLSVPGMT